METWKEIYKGVIPEGNYQLHFSGNDKTSFLIKLESQEMHVDIRFQYFEAVRIQSIVESDIYASSNPFVQQFMRQNFRNILYEISENNMNHRDSDCEEELNENVVRSYAVITDDLYFNVISERKPSVTIVKLNKCDHHYDQLFQL